MKKLSLFFTFILITTISLAGCGTNDDENSAPAPSLEPIEVTIQLPDKIDPDKEVTIQTTVTQDGKAVNDAEEVQFEIWEINSEEHEKIIAENRGDGIYAINKSFDTDGTYNVISHVTARGMHTMPKEEFIVGTPSKEENTSDGETHEHASESEGHHDNGLVIELIKDDTIKANTDVTLTANVNENDQPLKGATVQFELWKENTGEDDRQYVDATETSDGVYEAKTNFKEADSYLITVHVAKEEIHDHLEQVVKVK